MLFREEDEDLEVLPFVDRAEAGRVLASKLSAYSGRDYVGSAQPKPCSRPLVLCAMERAE
jgi:hypothetical protein